MAPLETRVAVLEAQVALLETQFATPTPEPTRGAESSFLFPRRTPALTPTRRPTRTPSAPKYEIISVDSRVTESNDVFWKYAWILEVENSSRKDMVLNAEIQFQDADGFVVDTAYAFGLILPAGETKKFSDSILIRLPGAESVENIYAQTTVVR
jgi:hypothetical protein